MICPVSFVCPAHWNFLACEKFFSSKINLWFRPPAQYFRGSSDRHAKHNILCFASCQWPSRYFFKLFSWANSISRAKLQDVALAWFMPNHKSLCLPVCAILNNSHKTRENTRNPVSYWDWEKRLIYSNNHPKRYLPANTIPPISSANAIPIGTRSDIMRHAPGTRYQQRHTMRHYTTPHATRSRLQRGTWHTRQA